MTVLTFPSSPQNGDHYTAPNGVLYTYDGVKWTVVSTTITSQDSINFVQDSVAPIFENISGNGISFTYNPDTNSLSATVTGGGNANTGTITFNNDNIYGSGTADGELAFGKIQLVPNPGLQYSDYGQYLNIYPTLGNDAPHIHIAAGKGNSSTGDLMLGDDQQFVDINHDGMIRVQTYDRLRGNQANWEFTKQGVLSGPAMGGLFVYSIGGAQGQDLQLMPGWASQNTIDLVFSDADGTAKDTYLVDTNYGGYNFSIPVNGATLWYAPYGNVAITNISYNENLATFTLGAPVTLQPGTYYSVDWQGADSHDVAVYTNNGTWKFKSDGYFENNHTWTKTSGTALSSGASGVVWTANNNAISSVKLIIQVETPEVNDPSGWHCQSCEAIISSRGYAGNYGVGDPVMSVYGVTYTSTEPLATFTVHRNVETSLIEVIASPTAATDQGTNFIIHSVELASAN